MSGLSPSRNPELWGLGSLGSLLRGSIAGRFHCCCKEQQRLSPPDSPGSMRWCHHARPGQNLDLSDPRATTLRPHSLWTHRQGRAGGTVGARASRAEHAAVSVAKKLSQAVVMGAAVGAVAGGGGGWPRVGWWGFRRPRPHWLRRRPRRWPQPRSRQWHHW